MCTPIAAAGIGLVGSVVQGAGAASQAKTEQASLNAKAAGQERQAEIDKKSAEYEVARTEDTIRRTTGAQRAGFSANGIAIDSGSAGEVIRDTENEGLLDIAAIRWNSQLKQDNSKYDAKISRMNADSAGASAGLAFLSPVIGGVAKFAGAF